MMASAEKRRKLESCQPAIFSEFLKDGSLFNSLRSVESSIRMGTGWMTLHVLQVDAADARACVSFINATCLASSHKGSHDKVYNLESMFHPGTATLRGFLNKTSVPVDRLQRKALEKLLRFLSTDLNCLQRPELGADEGSWATEVAEHLLSNLAVGGRFKIHQHYVKTMVTAEPDHVFCPCGKDRLAKTVFSDTSFGYPDGWHGQTDIIMDNNVAVKIVGNSFGDTRRSAQSGYENDYVEKNFKTRETSQLLAQNIVFSFLQRKENGGTMNNYLVPSIGINRDSVVVHFYDSEKDVLLESGVMPLWVLKQDSGLTLHKATVVFLWLTLNYHSFCSGVTACMESYKSGFHEHLGNGLSKYEEEVERPLPRTSCKQTVPDWSIEANTFVFGDNENCGLQFEEIRDDRDEDGGS